MASGWQEGAGGFGSASQDEAARPSESLVRPPLRNISDPYPTYSAVALDLANDEIILQDENLFQIMVYDRLDNTPPSATMTEPKRIIGGHSTKIEFNCGLYVDPQSGDIYSVNNDTINTMVIFNRDVRGDTPPTRELRTPHGSYGIAVDEQAEEMFLTIQHDNAVVVFDKYAQDDDAPIRLLQGARTRLADPHGIAVDPANRLMFVGNYGNFHEKRAVEDPNRGGQAKANWPIRSEIPGSGRYHPPSITIYALDASGDSPPLRTIQGPTTQLNWPAHIALDQEMQELYVANDGGHSILVFDAASDGDAAPKRVIQGPRTQIKNPTGIFRRSDQQRADHCEYGESFCDRISAGCFRERSTQADYPGRAAGTHGATDRKSGGRRIRYPAGRNSRAQLSGSSADCDLCQDGKGRRCSQSSDFRSGHEAQQDDARHSLQRKER